jgi:hypothetical protein
MLRPCRQSVAGTRIANRGRGEQVGAGVPKRQSRTAANAPPFLAAYPPSWVNRLIAWIERQPGPAWVYYVAAVVLLGALLKGVQWFDPESAAATFGGDPIVFSFYPVYFVALMHYLDGQARAALEAFRPALGADPAEVTRTRYELTTVPARGAWIATALGVPLGFAFIVPSESKPLSPRVLPFEALAIIFTILTVAAFFVLAYHTLRQLRRVSRLHAEATSINLLQPQPTYAFSRLTARTAIGVVVFLYVDFLVNPPTPGVVLPYITFIAVATLLMAAAFLLPLLGMHRRLQDEKARLIAEVNQAVETVYRRLLGQAGARPSKDVNELDKVLSGLLRMRDIITRLSTWPWQPETLRGVIAAVGLPIAIWLIQFGLGKLLG